MKSHSNARGITLVHNTRGITLVMFESKRNGATAQELLKSHGLKLDTEYPENNFAMTYNHNVSAIDKMITDS